MMSDNELRWDFGGSFHFSKISSESYRYPPLQKPKKRDKGGVSVAKPWDEIMKKKKGLFVFLLNICKMLLCSQSSDRNRDRNAGYEILRDFVKNMKYFCIDTCDSWEPSETPTMDPISFAPTTSNNKNSINIILRQIRMDMLL